MGLKKGMTNNPNGRPLGALNALAKRHRITVDELLRDNLEKVKGEMAGLRGLAFVRIYIDLLKYVIPPAQYEPEPEDDDDKVINNILNTIKDNC
jgi:hypothetical protein